MKNVSLFFTCFLPLRRMEHDGNALNERVAEKRLNKHAKFRFNAGSSAG